MANTIDYSGMDEATLGQELANLKREQFNLRFQAATSQLEKPSRVREVRRDIARIKTLQTARSRDAQAK
jgi:large subunit ribosomal protein L29